MGIPPFEKTLKRGRAFVQAWSQKTTVSTLRASIPDAKSKDLGSISAENHCRYTFGSDILGSFFRDLFGSYRISQSPYRKTTDRTPFTKLGFCAIRGKPPRKSAPLTKSEFCDISDISLSGLFWVYLSGSSRPVGKPPPDRPQKISGSFF